MPEVECTQLRYHCTTLPDLDLCPQAYADGRFPAGCTARDFVRIDQSDMQVRRPRLGTLHPVGTRVEAAAGSNAQAVSGVWSDQDTLLMLEGLELFGDNWAEIADHVGTKSQVWMLGQCWVGEPCCSAHTHESACAGQVQCIMHFLRLPVEDEYLDQLEHPGKRHSVEPKQAERGDAVVPFAEQSSPVMAQVGGLRAGCGRVDG